MDMVKKGKSKGKNWFSTCSSTKQLYRNNYVQAEIDYTQQNSKRRLRWKKDETINHIVSEGVGKVIHWELCKTRNTNYTTK